MTTKELTIPIIHPFWQKYLDITSKAPNYPIDFSKKPSKIIANNLIRTLPRKSDELLHPLAELYLTEIKNITEPAFRNFVGIIGRITPEQELALVDALTRHQRFTDLAAFDVFQMTFRMKNPELKSAVENCGYKVKKADLKKIVNQLTARRPSLALSQ